MTSPHIQQKFKETVLVVGSNSFIGKNIISEIPFRKIFCLQQSKKKRIKKKNLEYFYLDLLDSVALKRAISKHYYDKVIICASNNNNSLNSNNNNIDIFNQNTIILLNVLESLKFNKKVKIINFSSTEISKRRDSIYSVSKKSNNLICKFYASNYGLKINNLVMSNVFGSNDLNFNRIIPFLIKNILSKKKIILKKNKEKIKFIYIDDLLKALIYNKQNMICNYSVSVNVLKKKILYLIKLKNNLKKTNFKNLFDFNLYKTINWYKDYFNIIKL